eukprot:TRINITY_DN76479_c0_g1_i1.p1 TRINITY_DN76479_c0_g1~~TRINITY_DN76479_c0_g1_i1.p1  ORF type:complete len:417 (-),score=32.35 TRINITY_DN76479_c0_g1_i1:202-1452(-)
MTRRLLVLFCCSAIAHYPVDALTKKPLNGDAASRPLSLHDREMNDARSQSLTKVDLRGRTRSSHEQAKNTSNEQWPAHQLIVAYGVAFFVMVVAISYMYHPLGLVVVVQAVLYMSCLALVKIAIKLCYKQGFYYPSFITAMHLMMSSSAAFLVLLYRRIAFGQPVATPTRNIMTLRMIPIACIFGCTAICENSAIAFVSVVFSEVVVVLNPVVSFCCTWIFGLGANARLLFPILVISVGCLLSMSAETYLSPKGTCLLLVSVILKALKAVLQQKLLSEEMKEKFDPVALIAWTCLFGFAIVGTYSLMIEGYAPVQHIRSSSNVPSLMSALLGSTAIEGTVNILAFFVIEQLGAVGMQIVSQMKALLVVIGGIALLGESFSNSQRIGFLLSLSGVFWYSSMMRVLSAKARGSRYLHT